MLLIVATVLLIVCILFTIYNKKVEGLTSFGKCVDRKKPKLNSAGTNCTKPFGVCGNNKKLTKIDASGTNCNNSFTRPFNLNVNSSSELFSYPNSSSAECAETCLTTSNCTGYSIDDAKTCSIKGNMFDELKVDPTSKTYIKLPNGGCPDGTNWKYDKLGSNCSPPLSNNIIDGYNIEGKNMFSISGITTDDLATCDTYCMYTPGCKATVYNKIFQRCSLKSTIQRKIPAPNLRSNIIAPYGLCSDFALKTDLYGKNCKEYTQFGICDDKTTKKVDGFGTNCYENRFGFCENSYVGKKDVLGSNCEENRTAIRETSISPYSFGKCSDNTTEKIDKLGTNCVDYLKFGYCKNKTTQKVDYMGTNCSENRFGFCNDNTAKMDASGTNCNENKVLPNNASTTPFGYCKNNTTQKVDEIGKNCDENRFGFCNDNTAKMDASGTNCNENKVLPTNASTTLNTTSEVKEAFTTNEFGFCMDNTPRADINGSNCSENQTSARIEYGMCNDGTRTQKIDISGTNCLNYSVFGLCSDALTAKKDKSGTNCPIYYGICPDTITPKTDLKGINCPSCPDGVTKKEDQLGKNCPGASMFGMCSSPYSTMSKIDVYGTNCPNYTIYGWCADGVPRIDNTGTNCSEYSSYGLCQDGVTKRTDAQGTNCPKKQVESTTIKANPVSNNYYHNPETQQSLPQDKPLIYVDSDIAGYIPKNQYSSTASDIKPDESELKDMKRNEDGKTILTGFGEFTDKPSPLKSMFTKELVESTTNKE